MKIPRDTQRMDLLKITRIEAANVLLLARSDLSLSAVLSSAEKLNGIIVGQFPEADDIQRVKIARDLAQQLDDPHPHLVANIMRSFYARKGAGDSSSTTGEGMEEREIPRRRTRPCQQR